MKTKKELRNLVIGIINIELGTEIQLQKQINIADRLIDALIDEKNLVIPSVSSYGELNKLQHCCGLMGFNPMIGDTCPVCDAKR